MSLTQRTSLLEPADATPSTRGRGLHRSVTMSELNDGGAQKAAMLAILTYFVVGVAYYGYLATPEKFALVDALYEVPRGYSQMGRGAAAAATWIFRRRVAAPPRLRRGYSVETR